jgi:hypothetical protein
MPQRPQQIALDNPFIGQPDRRGYRFKLGKVGNRLLPSEKVG